MLVSENDTRRINEILKSPVGHIIEVACETPPLSSQECKELFIEYMKARESSENYQEAVSLREQLLLASMRLVFHVAKRYEISNIPLEDLFQQGILGLLKAFKKFDISENVPFSNFAARGAHLAIISYTQESDVIRVPIHIQEKIQKIKKGTLSERSLSLIEKRNVTLGKQALQLEDLETMSPTGDIWAESIYDGKDFAKATLVRINESELQEAFEASLTVREELIIKYFFGLNVYDALTLDELSKKMRLDKDYVEKIKNKALRKLLTYFKLQKIISYGAARELI